MKLAVEIPLWLLSLSYWIHLISTIVWLGGLALMAIVAWPSIRRQILNTDQWLALLKGLAPWANASLVLLWVTGFLQMTADPNYEGFLAFNSLWAQAILVKHIAVIGMMVFGLYIQWQIHPALGRLAILEQRQPAIAQAERKQLARREHRLLWLNLMCAAAVLLCTAVATAI